MAMHIESLNTPERDAKREIAKKKGFKIFMDNPMAKALMSLQPANEHMEALLMAAFSAGFDHGGGNAAVEIAELMMQRRGS